jgi:hypothetical protein
MQDFLTIFGPILHRFHTIVKERKSSDLEPLLLHVAFNQVYQDNKLTLPVDL